MYGILKAVILYYECFTGDILAYGFKLNEYDCCVANKIVDGTPLTICWHVDSLKASHKKKEVLDKFNKWRHEKYKCIFKDGSVEMTIYQDKVHDYLRMKLGYTKKGKSM